MARRKVFWHIGPDDLGTAYLAHALDARREELAAAGVLVPGTVAAWELATGELRRNHLDLGYARDEVEGQNAQLVRRIWKHKGTSVLSTPGLASATKDQVMLALDGIRGAEIHLVLVERDLTSQVYAGAQAALESGATTRPATYADRVVDPAGEHPQAQAWRAGHDLPDVLRRWSRTVHPEHVHVIAETDPAAVWNRLTALLDVDVPAPDDLVAAQLGPAELGVLREVAVALDDQLDARGRRTALRDRLSRGLLPSGTGFAPLPLDDRAQVWAAYVTRKGFDMQGTLTSTPAVPEGTPTGDDSLATALAEALVEVARLEQANTALTEENLRLDRKRRKHKKRARELSRQQEGAA